MEIPKDIAFDIAIKHFARQGLLGADFKSAVEPPRAFIKPFTNSLTSIDVDLIVKNFTLILGQRGSGKSNAGGRLLEDLAAFNFKFFVLDLTGEHVAITELFPGRFDVVSEITRDGKTAAQEFLSNEKGLILDLSNMREDEYLGFLSDFLFECWEVKKKEDKHERKPVIFFFEEAHVFLPQTLNFTDRGSDVKQKIKQIVKVFALEGRKFGFAFIGLTQRASKLDKDIATQAGLVFVFKLFYPNDVELAAMFTPGTRQKQLAIEFQSFNVGECFYINGEMALRRRFKPKKSKDFAGTPGLKEHMGWKYGKGI